MGEGGHPDVRRVGFEGAVDEVGDVVRHGGELRHPLVGDGLVAHLQRQVGDDRAQVGVPGALAVAVDASLHLEHAEAHRRQRAGHRRPRVVVEVAAERRLREGRHHLGQRLLDLVGQGAAVGVAQHEPLGPCVMGGIQHRAGETRVGAVAVEEVLGVEEDPAPLGAEVGDRVGHHCHRVLLRSAQGVLDVVVPRLADEADDPGAGGEQGVELRIVLGPAPGPSGSSRRRPGWRCGGRARRRHGRRTRRPSGWRRASRPPRRARRGRRAGGQRAASPRRSARCPPAGFRRAAWCRRSPRRGVAWSPWGSSSGCCRVETVRESKDPPPGRRVEGRTRVLSVCA